jgi:NADH-quinone oxidoreductase subunit N
LLKGRRLGSEAALKYSIYGAGTAGVMLYGISLIAGLFHTAHLPTLTARMAETLPAMSASELMVLALAGLMLMVGLAFKLSAVPFHFWCPDVFEGATAEVDAFLSVASKAAALALLVRVVIGMGAITPAAQPEAADNVPGIVQAAHAETPSSAAVANERLHPARDLTGQLLALLAAITCTFGNLAAYAQNNLKRLLAYSTIAHAGYMMMPVSALLVMVRFDTVAAASAVSALAIYLGVYLFMNLTAFAVVAFLRNTLHSEQINDYAGLVRRCPTLVVCFAITLFGLIGLPPLSGFIGKFAIFAALVDGYQISVQGGHPQPYLLALLIVGGLNTVLSLFYYLRVIKVMTFEEEPADRRPFSFSAVSLPGAFICLLTAPTALLIVNWDVLNQWATAAARFLLL